METLEFIIILVGLFSFIAGLWIQIILRQYWIGLYILVFGLMLIVVGVIPKPKKNKIKEKYDK